MDIFRDITVNHILPRLGPEGTAALACTGRSHKDLAYDDTLWCSFLSESLQLTEPLGPNGDLFPTFKDAYNAWRISFPYNWDLVCRVKRYWDFMRMWLSTNAQEILDTLRPGASREEIEHVETTLGVRLPDATRILYRFQDGQQIGLDDDILSVFSPLGILGGYSSYRDNTYVHLFSLRSVIGATLSFRGGLLQSTGRSSWIVIAHSSFPRYKVFFLDCSDSQLYVGTLNLYTDWESTPCVPAVMIERGVGMLSWLEEHGRLLRDGIFRTRIVKGHRCISLFPEDGPMCRTAITNGVKVRISAVFMPECSRLPNYGEKTYWFSYSVRMSLLPGSSFSSCQLYRRHWIIRRDDEHEVNNTTGRGVIGQEPLLVRGGVEYVYASTCSIPTSSGSMDGSFVFIPGSGANPLGDMFEVEVPRLDLELPDYIF